MNLSCIILLSIMALSHGQSYEWTDKIDDRGGLFEKTQRAASDGADDGDEDQAALMAALNGVKSGQELSVATGDLLEKKFAAKYKKFIDEGLLAEICDGQNRFDILLCNSWMCNRCSQTWCMEKCQKVQKDFPTCRCRSWPEARTSYSGGDFVGKGKFGDSGDYNADAASVWKVVSEGVACPSIPGDAIDVEAGKPESLEWCKGFAREEAKLLIHGTRDGEGICLFIKEDGCEDPDDCQAYLEKNCVAGGKDGTVGNIYRKFN